MQETLYDDMGTPEPEGQDNGEAPPEPGFKKTKVGWIPEEWEVRQMRDVVQDVSAGRSIGGEERNIEDDEKGVLRTSAVTSGKFIPEEHKVVDPDDYDRLKKNPEEGDILFNRASGSLELVGVSVRVSSDYPNLFLSDKLWRIKADQNVSEKWLHHALESEHVVGRIRMYADSRSTGMKNIPQGDFLTIRVATPPPEEQRRIAEILSSWDRAIEQIDDLIAVKERRKKALMQQLLKGKTRLPGYGDEDWVEVRIGDLLKRVKRYVDWDDDAQYDLVSVKRGSEGLYHRKSIYGHEKKTKKLHTLKEGDFVISRMQVVHGATAYVTPEFEGMHVSDSYIILRSRDEANIDTEFFAWLAKMPYMYHLAYLASHGVHIEKMTFKPKFYFKSKVKIPPTIEEQREIVSTLRTIENEIETLRDEREALQRQKKGVMQKLLKGKIRVSSESTSPQVEA